MAAKLWTNNRFMIIGSLALLLFCISATGDKPAEALAPKSHYINGSHTTVQEMAAWEFIQALGLDDPQSAGCEVIGTKTEPSGSKVVHIRIPSPPENEKYPQGLNILYRHLAPTRNFYLLYNPDGHLIAVLPTVSKETPEKLKTENRSIKYFDFSPYNFKIPNSDDPLAATKWFQFSVRWKTDRQRIHRALPLIFEEFGTVAVESMTHMEIISDYEQVIARERHDLDIFTTPYGPIEAVSYLHKPYVYIKTHEQDPGNPGKVLQTEIRSFYPSEFDPSRFKPEPGVHWIVLPVYPTIYPPYNTSQWESTRSHSDYLYYSAIYPGWRTPPLTPAPNTLVLGPGCGIDCWLAWLRTRNKIFTVGPNPLEIANTRAAARIAGFEVEARIGDNIVTEDLEPVFPGMEWDWIVWNMPHYARDNNEILTTPALYDQIWDHDYGGEVLRRFLKGFKKTIRRPGGHSIAWNDYTGFTVHDQYGKPSGLRWDVLEILKESGVQYKAFSEGNYSVYALTLSTPRAAQDRAMSNSQRLEISL